MPLLQIEESTSVNLSWRLDAPRARLWQCITDADLLRHWLGELVDGAVRAGSEFVVDHGDDYCCRSTVVTYTEASRLDFTWRFPDEPESRVALVFDGLDGVTDLRLSHTGLGDLAGSYRDGWCVHLSYLEAAALGTPLPASMFWPLHSTIAHLLRR